MKIHLRTYAWRILGSLLLASFAFIAIASFFNTTETISLTHVVDRGDVQEIVSVSGFVEAKNTAKLSFPTTGIVTDVFVTEGTFVTKGDLLATLGAAKLVAQRTAAVADLTKAQAAEAEIVAGPTSKMRDVTKTSVANVAAALQNTIALETEKVSNAKATLLSSNLTALSQDLNEDATPPVVTGTYTCEDEGAYTLDVYSSGAQSGFSYNYSGPEEGITTGATRQPAALGDCGLYVQFTEGDKYNNSEWTITIPNTLSPTYVSNKNAYDLARTQQEQAIQAAEDAYTLATKQATVSNAAPRPEVVTQSSAATKQARAQIAAIDAQIAEFSITAPFDGVITNIDITSGETAGVSPVMTLLAIGTFELTARVPEIDITKVLQGQLVTTVFDAQVRETLTGSVSFVSPLATEIDGVAYFETTITLDQEPQWMRSGLNADVEIITHAETDTVRIPKRFLLFDAQGDTSVRLVTGETTTLQPVTVQLTGNNGYVAVTGINQGDTIAAPEDTNQ